MIQNKKPCLRCLLQDADEGKLFEIIQQRIAAMPAAQKASPEEYARRLSRCGECEELISGTCRKCGCYAELRAAKLSAVCPHEKPKW